MKYSEFESAGWQLCDLLPHKFRWIAVPESSKITGDFSGFISVLPGLPQHSIETAESLQSEHYEAASIPHCVETHIALHPTYEVPVFAQLGADFSTFSIESTMEISIQEHPVILGLCCAVAHPCRVEHFLNTATGPHRSSLEFLVDFIALFGRTFGIDLTMDEFKRICPET